MEYEEWVRSVPVAITADVLWKTQVYRLALYSADLGWGDVTKLLGDRRTSALADQLYRALGSVSANIAEGYGRGTGRDRARFLEYALGSARESRDWYYKARFVLGDDITARRLEQLTRVTRLLLVMIPNQRGQSIGEDPVPYAAGE
ncbi:MAG: four helix bundle protein [Dehalococcoidia bacterium]